MINSRYVATVLIAAVGAVAPVSIGVASPAGAQIGMVGSSGAHLQDLPGCAQKTPHAKHKHQKKEPGGGGTCPF
jgi:hypothetical protein